MDFDTIKRDTEKICREVFENDSVVLTEETTADDIDEWDSFAHVTLVMEIEKHFHIRFALGELQDLKDVGELLHLIRKKVNEVK